MGNPITEKEVYLDYAQLKENMLRRMSEASTSKESRLSRPKLKCIITMGASAVLAGVRLVNAGPDAIELVRDGNDLTFRKA